MRLALVLSLLATGAAADDAVLAFRSAKGEVAVSAGSILSVVVSSDLGGYPAVDLQLAPAAAREFSLLTERSVGMAVEVLVCGSVVIAPVVQEPIAGGRVTITGEGASKAAVHLAALEGRGGCP